MHRRDRRELFSPRGLRAYQDGNDLSDWISGRTVDRAVILCAAEECGGVLLHRATSRFANFSSAGRPGRICPQGHCVPAHRRPVRSIGRPPRSSGSSNFGSALTSRPGPMGLPRKPRAVTLQSGHGGCCGVRYVPAHRRSVRSIGRPAWLLGQLQLWFGPHLPTGADGFATQTTGRHRPVGAWTLLRGQVRACPP